MQLKQEKISSVAQTTYTAYLSLKAKRVERYLPDLGIVHKYNTPSGEGQKC